MNDLFNALGRLFSAVLGLIFWLFAAALGLLLAAVVAVLLLVGVVWALLRGRRPVRPVYVHQFQTYARERVWPGPTRLMHRNHRFEPEGGLAALL